MKNCKSAQVKIGITGGIGSGKTMIADFIRTMGYPVYDADTQSKTLCNTSRVLREKLIENFGDDIYTSENELNKVAFSAIIFNNPEKLKQANAIIHPEVTDNFLAWCGCQTAEMVFVESAILLQSPLAQVIDKTIAVLAPEALRVQRVVERAGVKPEEVIARIQHQLSDEALRKKAHFIVENDGSQAVIPQVELILSSIYTKRLS